MPPKRDHKDIMGLKCGVCLGSTNLRPISQAVLLMIRSQVYSEYDIGSCPGKVCSSCDKTLRDRAKNGTASKWKLPGIDLEKIVARRVTRATAGECLCGWCELGHIKGKLLVIKMEELGYRKTLGRPKSLDAEDTDTPAVAASGDSDKICRVCKGVIARGVSHVCGKRERQTNMLNTIDKDLSPSSQQRLASALLNKQAEDAGVSTSSGTIVLASGSKHKMVTFGPQPKKKQATIKDFFKLQKERNFSNKDTIAISTWYRGLNGRKSVEIGLAEAEPLVKEDFRDFFEVKTIETVRKTKKEGVTREVRNMGFCTDIEAFVTLLCELRGIENVDVQFNVDDGQQAIKYSMVAKHREIEANEKSSGSSLAAAKFKLSGVKRILYVGLLPQSQENRQNVRSLLQSFSLSHVPGSYSQDMKMILYMIGKQDAGCKHPCYACTGSAPWDKSWTILTVGMAKKLIQDYRNAIEKYGIKKVEAMDFGNFVNDFLLDGYYSDDTELQDIFNIPVLHILLGVVAKAIQHIKNSIGKDGPGERWFAPYLKSLNITESYYGGRRSLTGNDCHKVLQNTEKLADLAAETLSGDTKNIVMATVSALAAFKDVLHLCGGERILGDYKGAIAVFSKAWRAVPRITVPVKVHVVESHVIPFLERKASQGYNGHGLAHWSESPFEAAHRDWKLHWEKVSVGLDHTDHSQRLLDTLLDINARNQ